MLFRNKSQGEKAHANYTTIMRQVHEFITPVPVKDLVLENGSAELEGAFLSKVCFTCAAGNCGCECQSVWVSKPSPPDRFQNSSRFPMGILSRLPCTGMHRAHSIPRLSKGLNRARGGGRFGSVRVSFVRVSSGQFGSVRVSSRQFAPVRASSLQGFETLKA